MRSLLCVAVIAAVANAAHAENESLSKAQALYDGLRYDEAYQAYQNAIVVPGNRPEQIADVYLHLGILAASMDRSAEAVDHFSRLLCINPQAQLADGVSPKVRGPFLIALDAQRKITPFRLFHTPPAGRNPDASLTLDFELQPDSLGLAAGISVRHRLAGATSFEARPLAGVGKLRVVLPPDPVARAGDLEYYIEVNDRHGGVLWEYASARSPVVVKPGIVAVAAARPGETPLAAGASESGGHAWYQSPWVWVAAGAAAAVVVAGGATAAVVAATAKPSTVTFGAVESEVAQ